MLAGCTWGNKASYETTLRTPTDRTSIEVVDSATNKRAYKVIGMVSSRSMNPRSALASCRKEASELGGNAILDFHRGSDGGGAVIMPVGGAFIATNGVSPEYEAKVIVWQ